MPLVVLNSNRSGHQRTCWPKTGSILSPVAGSSTPCPIELFSEPGKALCPICKPSGPHGRTSDPRVRHGRSRARQCQELRGRRRARRRLQYRRRFLCHRGALHSCRRRPRRRHLGRRRDRMQPALRRVQCANRQGGTVALLRRPQDLPYRGEGRAGVRRSFDAGGNRSLNVKTAAEVPVAAEAPVAVAARVRAPVRHPALRPGAAVPSARAGTAPPPTWW